MDFTDFSSIAVSALSLDSLALRRFEAMESLYIGWNARINVVSRQDVDKLYEHHVLHSLSLAFYLRKHSPDLWESLSSGRLTVFDLGTGGGFPGIPLAIVFPSACFILCDSVGKKLKVAGAVVKGLGLENVRLLNSRAEEVDEKFGLIVSRAVAPLDKLYSWTKGKCDGPLLCLKGGAGLSEEISQLMRRQRVPGDKIATWPIQNWLTGDWFKGKFVVVVGK